MSATSKVVYVAGSGRSGSTVLGQVLGAVPGWMFCGEVRQGFSILAENRICGCGAKAQECGFWRSVVKAAFGTFDLAMLARAAELTRRVSMHRHSLTHLSPLKTSAFLRETAEYREILSAVYGGIRLTSGCDVIVDSSKIPSYYFIIRQIEEIENSIVHIVRDSRAVVYSNKRKKYDPSRTMGREFLAQQGVLLTSIAWNLKNGFIGRLMANNDSSVLLRYEDFATDPAASVRRVLDLVDPSRSPPPFRGGELEIGTQHTLGGNPVKFRAGPIRLRLDDEWQSRMGRSHRAIVTALTWPTIATYGYVGRGRRSDPVAAAS